MDLFELDRPTDGGIQELHAYTVGKSNHGEYQLRLEQVSRVDDRIIVSLSRWAQPICEGVFCCYEDAKREFDGLAAVYGLYVRSARAYF